jgi:glycosyltransferase involved in cell wall biosynthesis
LAQTFESFEIIVVIDGPDDETAETLASLNDSRLVVLQLETNVGGADARNAGIIRASGEWIALLDDDDEWLPEKLAVQIDVARLADNRALVTAPFILRQHGGIDRVRPTRPPAKGESYPTYLFDTGCGYQTSTLLCSRWLARTVPFKSGLRGCQDLDWVLTLSKLPGFSVAPAGDPKVPLAVFNAPLGRPSVSNSLPVSFLLDWAEEHKDTMGPIGYSRFLISACIPKSIRDETLKKDFIRIIKCWLSYGILRPSLIGRFIINCAVSSERRRRIKDFISVAKFRT